MRAMASSGSGTSVASDAPPPKLGQTRQGFVHRDIKPKNCMLSGGSALIIDFGFAERAVEGGAAGGRVCASGQVRGELRYVLAKDVARLRGCREGDCFAMGKTIYEVVFGVPGSGESSGKQAIDAGSARNMNERFRSILESASAGDTSRFRLGRAAAEHILDVCRGLCRESNPMSFADAEEALLLASGVADAGHGGISDDRAESWRLV
jgi:serine/threonine protein kinase